MIIVKTINSLNLFFFICYFLYIEIVILSNYLYRNCYIYVISKKFFQKALDQHTTILYTTSNTPATNIKNIYNNTTQQQQNNKKKE